jgi:hypothetical protein
MKVSGLALTDFSDSICTTDVFMLDVPAPSVEASPRKEWPRFLCIKADAENGSAMAPA